VNVLGKDVQIHGFFQQGFAYSSGNNFLTMRTRGGSWAMTDGGINVATRLTSRLRVGAQAYSRNIGDLGNGQVQIDWAYADYKFSDMFGVRAGKVKPRWACSMTRRTWSFFIRSRCCRSRFTRAICGPTRSLMWAVISMDRSA
jgi:hypothetical protein